MSTISPKTAVATLVVTVFGLGLDLSVAIAQQ